MALANNYNPKEFEERIYKLWEEQKVGSPEKQAEVQNLEDNSNTYTILMPPPNLTGDLHAGHAFGHYLMDTLTRVHRQKGQRGLWYPGVDHAGIQLEGVIDKMIKKGELDEEILGNAKIASEIKNVKREDWSKFLKNNYRQEWLDLAWQNVNRWRDNQRRQSSVLGDTPDYDRTLFTLDDRAVNMVNYAFKKYWSDGLIYKGSYLVNWSVGLQTALSDVAGEIEYEKRVDPFITFEYRLETVAGEDGDLVAGLQDYFAKHPITVSTVRPETVFGDSAVAIHPEKFKEALAGVFSSQEIAEAEKLLEKDELRVLFGIEALEVGGVKLILSDKVDKDFGTGALKITPAHDPFDYEMYKEFSDKGLLEGFEVVVNRDGKLQNCPQRFEGLTVEEGRLLSIKLMLDLGYVPTKEGAETEHDNGYDAKWDELDNKSKFELLKSVYPSEKYAIDWNYEHNVTVCERSKTVIEPLISEEFFLDYHKTTSNRGLTLQKLALEGVEKTNFYSADYKERAVNFVENIHNWCISRDLVWGHRMPVWYNLETNPTRQFYIPENFDGNENKFRIQVNKPNEPGNWVQEEKILDTWFSSTLWPLSTLDYVESSKEIKNIVFDWFGVVYSLNGSEIESTKQFIKAQKAKGVRCYYLTNADRGLFDSKTDTEVFGLFDGGIASFQSQHQKPDLQFYSELLDKYNLNASETVYIDDSPSNVEAAKQLGIRSFWHSQKGDLEVKFEQVKSERNLTDFDSYYPTQVMTTAKEIFYIWVVRMIMLGMYFANEIPFENVVITPTVLDGQGRKMSKSLKNGLEPGEAIDKFSSDSLRLSLLGGMIPNRNMKFGGNMADAIMEKNRNFGNKIWNVARFFEYQQEQGNAVVSSETVDLTTASKWILQKYQELEKELEENLQTFELEHSIDSLTKFLWDYFADWYVEYLKTDSSQLPFANELFKQYIVTLSAYMPFETEVLWAEYFGETGLLAFEQKEFDWSAKVSDNNGHEEFGVVADFVSNIRSLRGLFAIDPAVGISVYTKSEVLQKFQEFIKLVSKTELIEGERSDLYTVSLPGYSYSLNILDYVKDAPKEVERTHKKIQDLEKQINALERQLGNENFVKNADAEVVESKKQDLEMRKIELEQQQDKLGYLE